MLVRDYNKKQEKEAYGIAAAVLLPWNEFFHSVNNGKTANEMHREYGVSERLVIYRIKITGAFSLFNARQRRSEKAG